MRIEAERLWDGDRPLLSGLTPELGRSTFLDRFAAVGRGTLRLKTGLTEPLLGLLGDGSITVAQYEQLFTFLDHLRTGLASQLYPRPTLARRARLARALGLDVPVDSEDDGLADLDVRSLVVEIADRFLAGSEKLAVLGN